MRMKLLFLLMLALDITTKAEISENTVKRPDGTVETTRTTKYYDPRQESRMTLNVYGLSVVMGGLIAGGGIWIILRSPGLRTARADAEIAVDAKRRRIKMKNLAQGSVVVIVGAALISWSLYRIRMTEPSKPVPGSAPRAVRA